MVPNMKDGEVLQNLTSMFQNIQTAGEYISLKIWTGDDNKLKFFFTNTPPKKWTNSVSNDSGNKPVPTKTNAEHVIQSSPLIETRSKKRKVADKNRVHTPPPPPPPEIVRNEQSIEKPDMNVSQILVDRALPDIEPIELMVPCTNRFSILENLDENDNCEVLDPTLNCTQGSLTDDCTNEKPQQTSKCTQEDVCKVITLQTSQPGVTKSYRICIKCQSQPALSDKNTCYWCRLEK